MLCTKLRVIFSLILAGMHTDNPKGNPISLRNPTEGVIQSALKFSSLPISVPRSERTKIKTILHRQPHFNCTTLHRVAALKILFPQSPPHRYTSQHVRSRALSKLSLSLLFLLSLNLSLSLVFVSNRPGSCSTMHTRSRPNSK